MSGNVTAALLMGSKLWEMPSSRMDTLTFSVESVGRFVSDLLQLVVMNSATAVAKRSNRLAL